MDETELTKILKKNLEEDEKLDKEKLDKIKKLIESGQYNVPLEEVVKKLLQSLKEGR